MDTIAGIVIGVATTLVIGVLIAVIVPKKKGDSDSYGRQEWGFKDED